jgi:hypothetical protein
MMPVGIITVAKGQISPVAIVEITHVATVLVCSSAMMPQTSSILFCFA